MYCQMCNSTFCVHTGHGLSNMAAQQQMGQAQYMAMLQAQMSGLVNREIEKILVENPKRKKLLLLRK